MLTNQKKGILYLSRGGAEESLRWQPGAADHRLILWSLVDRGPSSPHHQQWHGYCSGVDCSNDSCFPSMDNMIPLPILLQGGRGGVHASSHGNAAWAVAARDAGATRAVDWDAAVMSHRTCWETPRGRYVEHSSKFSLSMK
jgi:hypothetical protein